ncbi:DUF1993 domain-containing protein [Belnapia sp. T6]|uniref:DUF1993 domain-containing protein n=1 Tax=Belnapia mucosa TaxID=2804532 RepID=A0ABS1UZ37_9PROT|nr:DUF1993 domain-containing protein [Belnapia mucosa]MBL6454655.1 DUF1993 domain-containing protein [Belnapia mucosa]
MPLSLYEASVPVFHRGLRVLGTLLGRAEAHAAAQGMEPAALIGARLAPDMYTLAGQVQCASDAAKLCAARLAGVDRPSFADTEASFSELHDRITRTAAFLDSLNPAAVEAGGERAIPLRLGGVERQVTGSDYLLQVALPNFLFHVTTAYDILRHQGVALRKADYLGAS